VTLTVVTPVGIVLDAVQRFGTQFVFSYSADVGLRYAVERGTTWSNWTTIRTDTANANPMTVTDTAATNRMNFYPDRRNPAWQIPFFASTRKILVAFFRLPPTYQIKDSSRSR
jgi:hypothetical protein